MPASPGQDSSPITPEDLKRLGVNLELLFSDLLVHNPRESENSSLLGETRILDELVRSAAVNWNVRFGSFGILSELCLAHGITPDACVLSDKTDFKIDRALYKSKNFPDSRTKETGREQTGGSVCVKLLRLYSHSERKLTAIKQRFYHESARWKQVSHPNLVPVFEVSDILSRGKISLAVITPWASNGNITGYLQKHRRANKLELLVQVTSGLEHLHSLGIVHSSISPGNILVNENGQACLGDFGVNQIPSHHTIAGPERMMSTKPNARRYMPPELLNPDYDCCSHSEAGDIYSLAMTAFEILTGVVPYGDFCEDTIPHRIVSGERPDRPETRWLQDPVWEMLEDCWNKDPGLRWEVRCMRHRFSNPTTARVQGIPCIGGALQPLGVQLDQLKPDDCPKYLAKCLESAPKEARVEGVNALLIEVFDKVLGYRPFDPLISKQFRHLCDHRQLVPASYTIPEEQVNRVGEHPVASGGFGDVWKGTYGERHVAIKALRVYKPDDIHKASRLFYKEVTMWKWLSHPNIVPFLGVINDPAPLSMVSEWMPNGDIRNYVREHPEVDRIQLLLDICHGLQALHTHNIIHGDLKGANILINGSGWACLTDFGLSSIASLGCTESSARSPGGSPRWMAPELMRMTESQTDRASKKSDVYAFAMVTIEVFTGRVPFESCRVNSVVMVKVMNGERPTRSDEAAELGFTDELWDLIQSAWAQDAQHRPQVETIVDFLLRTA